MGWGGKGPGWDGAGGGKDGIGGVKRDREVGVRWDGEDEMGWGRSGG